jgi:cobalamin biosynthesis Co2+ chelatase CbiK
MVLLKVFKVVVALGRAKCHHSTNLYVLLDYIIDEQNFYKKAFVFQYRIHGSHHSISDTVIQQIEL